MGLGTQLFQSLGYIPCCTLKWERALESALKQEVRKGGGNQDRNSNLWCCLYPNRPLLVILEGVNSHVLNSNDDNSSQLLSDCHVSDTMLMLYIHDYISS